MKFAKTFALTAIASSALMMGGCANNGYGYNSGLSNTAKGATAGAAAGAGRRRPPGTVDRRHRSRCNRRRSNRRRRCLYP
ncbi:hypothetical protein [Psychrobacter sp.]|uniref:hypothetical protein n=1 Tax=Psychrobacter sp. TaxID=56811 RepID=UPI002FD939A0